MMSLVARWGDGPDDYFSEHPGFCTKAATARCMEICMAKGIIPGGNYGPHEAPYTVGKADWEVFGAAGFITECQSLTVAYEQAEKAMADTGYACIKQAGNTYFDSRVSRVAGTSVEHSLTGER